MELNCPCGHPIENTKTKRGHSNNGCLHGWPIEIKCDCTLTEAQAIRAAQFKEAMNVLRGMSGAYRSFKKSGKNDLAYHCMGRIHACYLAYCAIGVFGSERAK